MGNTIHITNTANPDNINTNEKNVTDASAFLMNNLSFSAKEAYKKLRSNIEFSFVDAKPNHIIGITSAQPSEGKSITAVNLAYTFAEAGKKVLLIDADMRKPSVGRKLGVQTSPGLSNLLVSGSVTFSTAVNMVRTESDAFILDVLCAGDIPPNPSELLNSKRMAQLLEETVKVYDLVIIDLPPCSAFADAQAIASKADGMLIVVRESGCSSVLLDECIKQLKFANAKILGFVLNGSQGGSSKYYSSGYKRNKYHDYYKYYDDYYGSYYGYYNSDNVKEKKDTKKKGRASDKQPSVRKEQDNE